MVKKIAILFVMLSTFFFLIGFDNNDNSNAPFNVKEVDAADVTSGTIYLKPNDNWTSSNAWFAAYFYKGNTNKWVKLEEIDSTGYYKATIPSGTWDHVIFCRMNSSKTALDWGSKWDQTNDLSLDGTNFLYTISSGAWSYGSGSWTQGGEFSFKFATASSLSSAPEANVCLSVDEKIWVKSTMMSTDEKYKDKTVYTINLPVIYGGVDKLEILKGGSTLCWPIGSSSSKSWTTCDWFTSNSASKLYYYQSGGTLTGWKSKINTTFYANYSGGTNKTVSAYTDDNITAPTMSRSGYDFYAWYDNSNLKNGKKTSFTANSTGYYASWSKNHTFYFATNDAWEDNIYANACLSNNSNIWENVKMTKETSQTYRGYSIYSVSIPVIYGSTGSWGLNYLEIHEGQTTYTNKVVVLGSETNGNKTFTNNSLSTFENRLYFDDDGDVDGGIDGWKDKVDTPFYLDETSIDSPYIEIKDRWDQDIISTNEITDPYKDGYEFIDWYNVNSIVVEEDFIASSDGYFAIWGKYYDSYFATNTDDWNDLEIETTLGTTGKLDITTGEVTGVETFRDLTVYSIQILVIENGSHMNDTYNITFTSNGQIVTLNGVSKEDLTNSKLYFYDNSGDNLSGWKIKVDMNFYDEIGEGVEPYKTFINVWESDIIEIEVPTKEGFDFVGWYDNENLEGVNHGSTRIYACNGNMYAYWGVIFTPGETIYLFPHKDWLEDGFAGIFLWGSNKGDATNSIIADMTRHINSDGSVYYTFVIPDNGITYLNAIFVWTSNSLAGETFSTMWGSVNAQTNDLTGNGNAYHLSEPAGNEIVNDSDKPIYNGKWVEYGTITVVNHNAGDNYVVTQVVDYEIDKFSIVAPDNKSFNGWYNEDGERIDAIYPLIIGQTNMTYVEDWVDAYHTTADFVVYYKECSTKENSYGVTPIFAGMNFYTVSDADKLIYYGSGEYSYHLMLKCDGVQMVYKKYDTYVDLLANLADFQFEFSCLLANGGIDDTNFDKSYEFIFLVVDRNTDDILLNSTLDTIDVDGHSVALTFTNLINQYIVEQRTNPNYSFDLLSDYEDKAIFQLHKHTYSDSEDVSERYINDAYYLYDYCYVCTHKEKVEGVTVDHEQSGDGYLYTTTVDGQVYSKQHASVLTYIFESKIENYSDDDREEVYAALTKNGILINEFKSLYAAIEACFDYDEKVRDYNPSGLGSYVVKIIDGEYDDRVLFRNKTSYIYSNDETKENTDMYWYYNEGASLQRYGYWELDYWTSLLATSKFISIQRTADQKSTSDIDEASINGHAASYEIFAKNASAVNSDVSDAFNYNYGLDSAANIFLVPGSTNARYWFNLRAAEIYPSFHESDTAWAYVGYTSSTRDFILHQGLKCDTRTGNWYYYVGTVTTTENGIEIEEMNIPGVTDVCYMTSTFDKVKGCYRPNENINLAIGFETADIGDGKYNLTFTLQMVFEDGRTIDKSITLESTENIASFRVTMGLDVDTSNDLADYMCGAEFKNVIIAYGQTYKSGVGTTHNTHTPYTGTDNYILTSVNKHSTLYNNVVSSKLEGNNGLVCSYMDTIPDILNEPIYNGTEDGTTRRVPVYNFSYRSIDNKANPFASKLQNAIDKVQNLYDIETIVQNDLIDSTNAEVSYSEYTLEYNSATAAYNTLVDQERTVLQMSYPHDEHGNKYNSFIYETKVDIDKIREFEYRASGNVYYAGTDRNEVTELGGQLSYNTKTDTHILLVSLPLYGRIELIDKGVTLTTANPTDGQKVVEISGLYTAKKKADWTQNLYTDGNDHTLYCSKASGSSYQIEYDWKNNKVLVKQSPNQTQNYVGPYQYKSSATGELYTKYDRLQYTVEVDGKISSLMNATFDPMTNLYTFTATLKDWDAVALYYDGIQVTKDNTKVVGLYGSYNSASTSDKLYWAPSEEDPSIVRFMRAARGNVEFTYRLIYDPVNARLSIEEEKVNTISGVVNETWSSGVSYWASGAVLRDPIDGWNKVTKSNGTVATTNANGYRMYVVVDAKGRICYMVLYPVNGFGGITTPAYYAHPLYRDYKNNPAIVSTDNYATWSLKVPEGGFGLTLHQDGTSYENINLLLSYLSGGTITAHGGDPNQIAINTRYSLDHGYRLSMSNDHKTLSISYTFS